MPWDDNEGYWKRSPLSLVGNVITPTMMLVGDADYRTPVSETEQYCQALKLQEVDSVIIRVLGTCHGMTARSSNIIVKVNNILAWCGKYRAEKENGG